MGENPAVLHRSDVGVRPCVAQMRDVGPITYVAVGATFTSISETDMNAKTNNSTSTSTSTNEQSRLRKAGAAIKKGAVATKDALVNLWRRVKELVKKAKSLSQKLLKRVFLYSFYFISLEISAYDKDKNSSGLIDLSNIICVSGNMLSTSLVILSTISFALLRSTAFNASLAVSASKSS